MFHFRNRLDAGQQLAAKLKVDLKDRIGKDKLKLIALPRGGLPIAEPIAHDLSLPLDIVVPRKIGCPGYEEWAVGALTESGEVFLNEKSLQQANLTPETPALRTIIAKEKTEAIRRMKAYRGDRPELQMANTVAIMVDDGIATGSTMRAAILSVKARGAKEVIIAVPVAAQDTLVEMSKLASRVVCVHPVQNLRAIGQWYQDFSQTTDKQAIEILQRSASIGVEEEKKHIEISLHADPGSDFFFV